MKYQIMTICALVLAAAIAACGNNESKKPAPAPSPEPAAETTPAPQITPAPSVTPGPQTKSAKDYDFRGAKWGASKAEVLKAEPFPPQNETDTSLTFEGDYKGQLTYVTYQFKDDKLYRGGIMFPTKRENAELYLENYEAVKKDVIEAYGAPVIDGEDRTNPDAVIDPDKKAEAICKGDLMYAAQWNLPRTLVVLTMRGNGTDCRATLIYMDRSALHSIADQDGSGSLDVVE